MNIFLFGFLCMHKLKLLAPELCTAKKEGGKRMKERKTRAMKIKPVYD